MKTAKRPSVSPARSWSFPVPRRTDLDNGLTALSFDLPGQHVLSVRLAVPLPLPSEPPAVEGIGTLMARTLDEGTQRWSAEEMAELLERRGVALAAGVGERGFVVDMDVPKRRFGDALDLLRQALAEPAFGEAEVRRGVRARLADIEQELASPGQRAAIEFVRAYYRSDSRVSRPTGGSAQTVAAITPAALREYHARHLGPVGGTVILAGDLSGVDIEAELEAGLGAWSDPADRQAPAPVPTAARADDATGIVLVHRPGAVQSELHLGCPGPSREVEGGWAPYPVLAFLIGGAPQARLDAVLREELGYTYGMRAGFRPRVGSGLFVASGSVRADVTAEALGATFDILRAARDGFTGDEARAGIDFLCETAPGRYATADSVADEAVSRALEGLDTEHTTRTLRQMRELTPKRLRRAYRSVVADTDAQWTTIVVGDAEAVGPGLERLADERGLGAVRVIDR
ncbi:putative Zn-dependent peptidase [Kineosphaera limosa]|uniref:Putative peptidase M16 family protein n=1 Tax=Kineosphaera limosa NBRC 100340 TaxID=1184609 RepID=K6WCZ8_9MICO|nr:pitrilysin family protein [Kineosphaera limosa]NYE02544.1 putative Zn-dependent peptidase [Kineosphaera limosa]GAB97155.1 putative peptidase M16 family protein [Kineosphaera limosa NBRC 100340]